MSFYKDLQGITKDIMSEFKQGSVQLVKVTQNRGTIDDPGQVTETIHDLDASVTGVSFRLVRRGIAAETDQMVTSSVIDGVEVTARDFILIDGVRHKIVSDQSVPAAGVKVAWKFVVRIGV